MFCLLSVTLAASCTADAPPGGSPAGDPFAATPADGPAPEIGPAPDDYRPTAAGAPSTDIWIGRLERAERVLRRAGACPSMRDDP